ncbi:plexin-B1-like [Ruditapes philippinarum]|uniref:plexin-B1-like n=1 Tax=Ruditapes philippinarum TaxID=129788 RepID=UPI00295A9927|nr:plexin-B1-like [Ruditapes philippinarum]
MYTSKLLRLCQNDKKFISFVDIPINCMYKGNTYNMLQTAVLADKESEKVFVGAFTRGNNPEMPEGESVICVVKLSVLDEKLRESYEKFAILNRTNADNFTRYLPDRRTGQVNATGYSSCNALLDVVYYAIGRDNYNLQAAYEIDEDNGHVTSLHPAILDGYDVVLAGTSKGSLYQFNLMRNLVMTMFDKHIVDDGSEIKGIQEDGNLTLYVMSTSKIIKYSRTNCSEFKTCQETMEKKNPHCGWCVYQNRSQTEKSCPPEEWIHSYEDCIELETDISGIAVGTTGKNVTVTAKHFVLRADKYMYKCRFSEGQTPLGNPMEITITGNTFICAIPEVKEHTDATIELMVNDFVLASTPFLFYKCENFKSCGKCVNTANSNCTWDLGNTNCQAPTADGSNIVNEVDKCPSLNENKKKYLASSKEIEVVLEASNIPSSLKFWCYVPKNNSIQKEDFKPATVDTNLSTLTCKMNITLIEASKGLDVPIFIKYGNTEQFSTDLTEFEDVYDNKVTVYSCEKLGKDCSHCKALKDHYKCKWSNANCDFGFGSGETCPAPKIEKIKPRDGPKAGGTALIIEGFELGTKLSDISGIKIAGVTCGEINITVDDETRQYFKNEVPSSIVCITGNSGGDKNGSVIVTVNGQSSTETVSFSYKTPKLTGMSPLSGPIAGGTKVTFYGRNLGIGNRHIDVVALESVNCMNIKVLPNVGFDVIIK